MFESPTFEAIYDLRTALDFLRSEGETVSECRQALDPHLEVARHYVEQYAGVPASSHTRDEDLVMYSSVNGHDIPVLMGLFGSRHRNRMLLTGKDQSHHGAFLRALGNRIPPQKIDAPPCQEVVIDKDIDLLHQLPILTLTDEDAGPYITMGLVLANHPDDGACNASIHRLCVQGKDELSISIYPGHHLGDLHQASLERGETLPVSINLGLDPAVYYASCLTEPLCAKGDCELEVVGGLRNRAVRLGDCISSGAVCLADAEIVIEAELTAQTCAENRLNPENGSMPEFLGYQGSVNPETPVPLLKVTAITHRISPIYQSLVGPGLEQSELQSITPEVATLGFLRQKFDLDIKDIYFNTCGGGLLMAVMQVSKNTPDDDAQVREAGLAVLNKVPPLKHLFLVDEDIDPYSQDDLLWALTTRFQADKDLHHLENPKPFMMDPSQRPQYRQDSGDSPISIKALFDCTGPQAMASAFRRPFN